MKTKAPPWLAPVAARYFEKQQVATTSAAIDISPPLAPVQVKSESDPVDIAHVGAIWKSARDKRTCIQAGLKSLNGSAYLDLRIFELDAHGRMRPTRRGITVSPQRLMQLAKLVGDAARKAHALGLTAVSS